MRYERSHGSWQQMILQDRKREWEGGTEQVAERLSSGDSETVVVHDAGSSNDRRHLFRNHGKKASTRLGTWAHNESLRSRGELVRGELTDPGGNWDGRRRVGALWY